MIAFVAGPYRAATREGIERNIQAARQVAARLWERGFGVICPHLNTAHFHDDCQVSDEGVYLSGYLEMLARSADVVVALPGWESSIGARDEVSVAMLLDIPIIFYPDLPEQTSSLPRSIASNGSRAMSGALAFCGLGALGLITSDSPTPVNYRDGSTGLAWTGIHLTRKIAPIGSAWSSRDPRVVSYKNYNQGDYLLEPTRTFA